jgi:hypothetical protein
MQDQENNELNDLSPADKELSEQVSKLNETLKLVEHALKVRLPDLEQAVVAMASVIGELEADRQKNESLIGILLSESPLYQQYRESQLKESEGKGNTTPSPLQDKSSSLPLSTSIPKAGKKAHGEIKF